MRRNACSRGEIGEMNFGFQTPLELRAGNQRATIGRKARRNEKDYRGAGRDKYRSATLIATCHSQAGTGVTG